MNKRQRDFPAANRMAKALRQNETYTERTAWQTLRSLQGLPGRFRRQAPVGPYVVDFVCHAAKLIVEIDGGIHRLPNVAERDRHRRARLTDQGYALLIVPNDPRFSTERLAEQVLSAVRDR